ncbi:Adenosylmethionine-8-amino-7-oxononanoate aminotransferase [Rubellimicrobium thermophilum DSM 16684]|uniref:Adenosylmethionine-8-amino-7-oxononanoate aminotransferase n=1 Tax=Rubellimicrobium thermophilum DSM 16684 TaxID=1123069 RepID=S9QP61_9RHOB|nr:aminotransferase class III-fold pyridoxal phosphate-dependent enzyme [Rubellimicrobium thermophilum]EPX83226.1 Adenosylmethionine-8-amino-7-oxononanoate aminotransferase [Rubellimicrobium thermophilum DSM 16684]
MDTLYDRANDPRAVIEADRAHVWHHLIQHKPFAPGPNQIDPRIMVEGRGLRVWDITGKEYVDAVSGGVWTVNVGYGRERIANALRDAVLKLNFWAGANGTIPGALFAETLIAKMPGMSRVYFSNSGSEANEKAFKMVRQIAHKVHGGKKWKILYRDRDYHGTTIACLSAGGQQERNALYGPFVPGFVQVPHCLEYRAGELAGEGYGERAADAIEEVILREGPDTVGALCLEPITAGGGIIVPPKGYWERVQDICRKYDILLHIDEVVCGIGRTGTWFGYQQFGIQPDIVTMAKGVASGYAAISCTVTTERVFEMFKDDTDRLGYFRDISTFGGCTGGPAAALENLAIVEEEDLLGNSARMGAKLHEKLSALMERQPLIGEVRGMGLFQGAELVADRQTREPLAEAKVQAVVADCAKQGVIIGASNRSMPGFNNTLLFAPALIATEDDLDQIVAAVEAALKRVA